MANNKDFVVKGRVEISGTAKQKTGTVSSSTSTVAVDDISDVTLLNGSVSGFSLGGIEFNSDGTYVYQSRTNRIIYQYALSTAWDTTTIAGTSTATLDVSATLSSLYSMAFNSDGTKLYLNDLNADTVYQYSLTTAYDITTASYDSKSFYYGGTCAYGFAMQISNSDQTLLLTEYLPPHRVHTYTLSTAGDISTASFTRESNLTNQTYPMSAVYNSDGTKLFVYASGTKNLSEYSLSTAYDTSTMSLTASIPYLTDFYHMYIKPDDTLLFGNYGDTFSFEKQQTSIDVDLSTGTVFNPVASVNNVFTFSNPPSVGTQNFKLELDTTANTSYDFANIKLLANSVISSTGTLSRGLYVKDASRFYTLSYHNAAVNTYNMSNFDLSTATAAGSIGLNDSGGGGNGGLSFKPDGSKVFICGSGSKHLQEYSLSTPWDISSHTYVGYSVYNPSGSGSNPTGFYFKPDGTRFYINYTSNIFQFDLTTPWSYNGGTANGSFTFSGNKYGLVFNDDGTKMIVSESASVKKIEEYTLSTPWDVSTASLTTTLAGVRADSFSIADNGKKIALNNSGAVSMHNFGNAVSATWPSSFNWDGNSAPEFTGQSGSVTLVTPDGGTTYLAK